MSTLVYHDAPVTWKARRWAHHTPAHNCVMWQSYVSCLSTWHDTKTAVKETIWNNVY